VKGFKARSQRAAKGASIVSSFYEIEAAAYSVEGPNGKWDDFASLFIDAAVYRGTA
jgi:hypothetical protein